jgi:hypothetical protein
MLPLLATLARAGDHLLTHARLWDGTGAPAEGGSPAAAGQEAGRRAVAAQRAALHSSAVTQLTVPTASPSTAAFT